MKTLKLLFGALLLLAGCTYSTYRPMGAPFNPTAISDRFIDIRFLPHNRDVNVFLPNESLPDSMVLPVRLIEQKSYYDGYANLINKMKATARRQGLDGVIILERDFISEVYEGTSSTYQVATGIGFIYKKTLNQVEQFRKRKYMEIWNNGVWEALGTHTFSTYGGVIKAKVSGDSMLQKEYHNNVALFDLDLILSTGGKNWYRKESAKKVNNLYEVFYSKRHRSPAGSYMIESEEIRFLSKYRHLGSPVLVEHRFNDHSKSSNRRGITIYQHKFKYHKNGMLKEVAISQKKPAKEAGPKLVQRFEYDGRGRRIATSWFKIENGCEIPFVRTSYDYYAPEDFLPSLRFAPDIPMRASANRPNKG